jgi:thiamine-phosphate pyrophosphorylase
MPDSALRVGRLYVLTDYHFQQRFSHADLADLAIRGGADTIQFRQKHGGIRHQLHEAYQTAEVCGDAGVPLIIDDRLDVLLAVQADGVHLGQTDFPIPDARRILGPDVIIGATASTLDEALAAYEDGADYIGFGPVFPTRSKANPVPTRGLTALSDVCRNVPIPVVAIAGITPERIPPVLDAGAHGVAIMTYITTAPDPLEATQHCRDALISALR